MRARIHRLDQKIQQLNEKIGGVVCDYVTLEVNGERGKYAWDDALPLIVAGHATEIEIAAADLQNGELAELCRIIFEE